jgi:hypothetical protein
VAEYSDIRAENGQSRENHGDEVGDGDGKENFREIFECFRILL